MKRAYIYEVSQDPAMLRYLCAKEKQPRTRRCLIQSISEGQWKRGVCITEK